MSNKDLAAAGITDPAVRASYERCRALNAAHGKTYYLATLLLPAAKRPFVHALYGFARFCDEIVDDLSSPLSVDDKRRRLENLASALLSDVTRGRSDDPILAAVVDTICTWSIDVDLFADFMHSMSMDLTVHEYATYEALSEYVYGSAAVIGLQMMPILGGHSSAAHERAKELGTAFQLANFVRDVGEDLDRGRVYLPLNELAMFGVDRAQLERREMSDQLRRALAFQVRRVRTLEESARPGIDLLHPSSRDCINAARILYCGIVDEVERNDYDVFTHRARVPLRRRLAVAGTALVRARRARRLYGDGMDYLPAAH